MTTLTERIAYRMAADGVDHPVAGAVALSLRGLTRLDRGVLADLLGVSEQRLADFESGAVALTDLPPAVWQLASDRGLHRADFSRLAADLKAR